MALSKQRLAVIWSEPTAQARQPNCCARFIRGLASTGSITLCGEQHEIRVFDDKGVFRKVSKSYAPALPGR
jgi:hypothetical protein